MGASTPFTPCRVFTALLVFSISMILVFQSQVSSAIKALGHGNCEKIDHAPDYQYHRTFPEVTPLEDLGPEGDEGWERLTPDKGGFIWIKYNETLNMPWGISMFHGIHCLQMLRGELQSQLGLSTGRGHHMHMSTIATEHDNHGQGADLVHIGHCLAYIAEILQCGGDSTIEEPWIKSDEQTGDIVEFGVDGGGVQHQCRDIDYLWEAAAKTEHKASEMWDYRPGDTVDRVFGTLSGESARQATT